MVAPIFKFRNVKVRLTTTSPTFIYGVISGNTDNTLASGIDPTDVSTVILTAQISNLTLLASPATVLVSAYVQNLSSASFNISSARALVQDYPLLAKNAFDPLSGNLVLSANDQLWLRADTANACDVVVSLLEIANATAS
jgi:hypothetical protein